MKNWMKKLTKLSKDIDNICVACVFSLIVFTFWLARMFDWMVKFWPFFCIVLIPFLLLSFLWQGFLYIGILIYLVFCGIKAFFSMKELDY